MAGAATRRGMKNGWNRTPDTGIRTPDSGRRKRDRDRDGDRDRVRDRDRIHLVTLEQPAPGLRTPDSGRRTGSDTDTVTVAATDTATDTATGWMEPVTGVPTVPFSGDYPMDQGPPVEA